MRYLLVLLLGGCATVGPPTLCVKGKKITITAYVDAPGSPPCPALEKAKKVRNFIRNLG